MKKPPPQDVRTTNRQSATATVSTGRRPTPFCRCPPALEKNSPRLPTKEFSVPAESISTPDVGTLRQASQPSPQLAYPSKLPLSSILYSLESDHIERRDCSAGV